MKHFTMDICYSVVVLYLIFFVEALGFQSECQNCRCCASGHYSKCDNNENCNRGCVNGYWGNKCDKKCQYTNCARCERNKGQRCYECMTGHHGIDCEIPCESNCEGCQKVNGQCLSCKNGYSGKFCTNECGNQCKTCTRWWGCSECYTGYYGSKCENYCGKSCNRCYKHTGCIACETGYYGSTCEYQCDDNCNHCDKKNGCTSCKQGYFVNIKVCSRCPEYCESCTSSIQCTSCTDGRFGRRCQYQCTDTCKHGICISTQAICHCNSYFTGETCDQCYSNYFGNECTQRCSSRCSDTCSQTDGSCTCKAGWAGNKCDTCADSYFGRMCNQQCNSNCASCTSVYNCQLCITGRYGEYCQHRCGKGCLQERCDKQSGYCKCKNNNFITQASAGYCHDCVLSRYGHECENSCPHTCSSCENESHCVSCHHGHYGIFCQIPCPKGCENNTCRKNDGFCLSCKDGFYGKHCNNTCPDLCQTCNYYNGDCTKCKLGYSNKHKKCTCRTDICINSNYCDSCTNTSYFANHNECCLCNLDNCVSCAKTFDTITCTHCRSGYFPNKHGQCKTCNSQCVEHKCDSSSGRCLHGCIDGYWSQTCDKDCDPECFSCKQADGTCSQCKTNTTYGLSCRMKCSINCKENMCDINGNCTNGCSTNTFGKHCENTCEEYCTPRDNKTLCSEQSGMCLYGCQTGYRGTFCPKVKEPEEDEQTLSTVALGGGVGAGIITLTVIVVVGLFLLRRRISSRNKGQKPKQGPEHSLALYATVNKDGASQAEYANRDTDNVHDETIIVNDEYSSPPSKSSGKEMTPILIDDNLEIEEDDVSAREIAVRFEDNGGVYYNNENEMSKLKLMVANLPEYVQNICLTDLEEEFQKVPYGLMKPYEVSQTKLNMHRNRYKGIYPYDDTRVVVRGGDTDYINASYIDGFRKRNAYIAALGPMAKQLGDFGQFWRMVWQQEVEKIAMVTNLVEDEKTKCDQYWPDRGQSKRYGDINVLCKVEKLYADFIWRQFTLSKNSEERNLHHLLFTSWPDKDIPDDVTSIIEFRQRLNALPSTFDGPAIVHCSAGVGRTGTYIALDILAKEGEAEGAIDIPGCVLNMRQNRPSMIQTMSQYQYLHQALVHSLTLDCSLIKREHFNAYMKKSSKQEIQKHFEKLQLTPEQKSDTELAATDRNRLLIRKNRKHADIPGDSNRPRLYKFLKPGESDYINAIYINSFRTKNRFLVAQTPLLDTVIDFIALAVQENCSCIVSMEAPLEKQMGVGLYFPGDNQVMKKGMFSVRSATCQSGRHFVKRMLHFEYKGRTKIDETIPHYEYLDWDAKQNVPKTAEHFVAFIKEVEYVSKSSGLKGPILVHCLNGAGKSGLFSVVWTLLEKLSEDNDVSVVNAVQKVRARRVLSVPNKEQFYFCYECVLHSVNETVNAEYYNISRDIQRE